MKKCVFSSFSLAIVLFVLTNSAIQASSDQPSISDSADISQSAASALIINGPIIADHTVIDQFDDIPLAYIEQIKSMWVNVPGESHSSGYRHGLRLLAELDPLYAVSVVEYGDPDGPTDSHLRINRAVRTGSDWIYSTGEEDYWTTQWAVDNIISHVTYNNSNGNPITAIGFGWCWDMINSLTGSPDPEHGVRWGGRSYYWTGDGWENHGAWGLDAEDAAALGGDRVSMDMYLDAVEQIGAAAPETVSFFTTGPVDLSSNLGESGYQRWLKHEYIRDYVAADDARVLFDYADILAWNDAGEQYEVSWNGHTFQAIHPDNDGEYEGTHIGEAGTIRLGKAMWWMLARIAGWDGTIEPQQSSQASGAWSSPETWSGRRVPGAGDNVTISSGNTVTVDANAQCLQLNVEAGATLVIPEGIILTVNGAINNQGTIRQTITVNNDHVSFLEFTDLNDAITYRGVDISTPNNLGAVTVSVNALDEEEFCTGANETSAAYAQRCFGIEVGNQALSTVRLWALTSEMNGVSNPVVFHYVPPNWVQLTSNTATGTQGVYSYAEASTPGFSHFLIADSGSGPTAVGLHGSKASDSHPYWIPLLPFTLALCASLVIHRILHRKSLR